jgi:L-ascorbate metabolism protein UlaG (beta-lactamase superfamily)
MKIINQIEPKIVIPMHYFENKKLTSFLKEIGKDKVAAIDKFSFKKKDIADKKGEVVVLKPLIN